MALCWVSAAFAMFAGTAGVTARSDAALPTSAVVPSIEILASQSNLAGTCGGTTFDLNTFINVDTQASADVKVSVSGIGTIEEFTDETGSNIGPFKGTYGTFHILSSGGGLAPNTPILISITTYPGRGLAGTSSFVSSLLFDCTTGVILNLSGNFPNAAPPIPALDDAALLVMSALLAALGAIALRRRAMVSSSKGERKTNKRRR